MSEKPVEIPQKVREQLAQLQQVQQTIQVLATEKQRLELELSEVERALGELRPLSDDAIIYKTVGALLIKADRSSVIKELEDRRELLDTRIKVLTRQESRARERAMELRKLIERELKKIESEGSG